MSVARLDRSPIMSRCASVRPCSGLSSGPTATSSTGTPTSTIRPRVVEVSSRIAATTRNDTTAPAARAVLSIALPRWERSFVPIATTSPVATFLGRVAPRCVACRATSCTVR
jgi:hypothetical protein